MRHRPKRDLESRSAGGIDSHLRAVSKAAQEWLAYQSTKNSGVVNSDIDLLLLSMAEEDAPQQPEALRIVYEQRRFGVTYFNGSIQDWPYMFRLELNEAINAEIEEQERVATNIRNAQRYASTQGDTQKS